MNLSSSQQNVRWKAVWGSKRRFAGALLITFIGFTGNAIADGRHARRAERAEPGVRGAQVQGYKLDKELTQRSKRNPLQTTRVIVTLQPGAQLPAEYQRFAKRHGKLGIVNGQVIDVPNGILKQLSAHPSVFNIHYDRPMAKFNYRTSLTVGTRAVHEMLGLTGAGVTVAVLDSGIATWHDDLTNRSSTLYPYGDQRVAGFVDFVNGQLAPYDDNGHGTHVSGIIAGNGYDSNGQKGGAAPEASLVSLKVLDANGNGTISTIITALEWVLANHSAYNIRVVNLSVGAAVNESYWTDPLTLAVKRVVDEGVVVVAASGNFGKNSVGLPQYGGISAPANAPWVITVGASSTNGTPDRADDSVATFSSRGPTYLDWAAKPDLVAPGTGTVSISAPGSTFDSTKSQFLLPGSVGTASLPYLSLSGTSMAAPVVSGAVALMLQANPNLTPNAVKAILQYTAQEYPGYDGLTQGAGFLNAVGAVRLARFFATARSGDAYPNQSMWSKHIIWGNHQLTGGVLTPTANAWNLGTTWGVAKAASGQNIVWGTVLAADNIVWGTALGADNIVWGTSLSADNIVWGTALGADNIVWGTHFNNDNILWGTAAGENNIVWGTDCGGADCGNIVWGTMDLNDNIVWGTALASDNIVWGTAQTDDNIVWGTAQADDNIVWGTASSENMLPGSADAATQSGAGAFDWLTDEQVLALAASPATTTEEASAATWTPETPMVLEFDSTMMPSGNQVIALDATSFVFAVAAPTTAIALGPASMPVVADTLPVTVVLPGGGL
jgi:serine protease AprX